MEKSVARDLLKNMLKPEQLIRDNRAEFLLEKTRYRINMPEHFDKVIADEAKDEYYMKLLEGGKFKRRELLIELYKKNGTNIEEFTEEFKRLASVIQKKQIVLHSLKDENKEKIEEIEKQIQVLEINQLVTLGKREELLKFSIEDKCEKYYILMLIIACSEIYDEKTKTWSKLYKDENAYNHGNENVNKQLCLSASYLFSGNE